MQLLLATLLCVHGLATPPTPTSKPAEPPHPFTRIALIGASVTWGFGNSVEIPLETYTHNEPIDLADVIEATLVTDHDIVVSGGDATFFRTPQSSGSRQVNEAVAAEPTLVLALDFLFWYGYGNRGTDLKFHTGADSRLAMLERGLKELDRFTCPVVVFDFPDMSPAIGIMLSSSQVPTPDELAALNTRLHDWAAERDNVTLLPLAATIDEIRTNEGFTIQELQWPAGSLRTIILPDQLHPTTDGTIALSQLALRVLDDRTPSIVPTDYHRDPNAVRSHLDHVEIEEARDAGMPVKSEAPTPPSED
ncbi:MAG: hypothetical protein P8K80_02910 [Phycisphaerales bacterium]|nr:hypothetical protein [Phycisphaerales bacterium]